MRSMRRVVPGARTAALAGSKARGGSPCANTNVGANVAETKPKATQSFFTDCFMVEKSLPRDLRPKIPLIDLTTSLVDSLDEEAKT